MAHITRSLLTALLEVAAERDPESVTVPLAVTEAGDIDGLTLDPETPVFTHFYLPEAGQPITAVFGVDLGTPSGQTPGLFVSHPDGAPTLSRTDDLREIVFVAIPPWEISDVRAYGRDGRRHSCTIVDGEPPRESPP